MDKVPPSKYLCWVVHLDGMEEKHDESVARAGVFKKAVSVLEEALDRGYGSAPTPLSSVAATWRT